MSEKSTIRPKILLLDDDKDLLELYREILAQLPSRPEIFTSSTGARAIAMLSAEPFTLLVSDLNMPKMDGLQVLSIVRNKFPELRTVVLTGVLDEQFRSRVYGLGVDLFWQKPASVEETKQFLSCIESLLGRESSNGFRGVQSKSLVDIIQLECLSHNSTVLKITNGPLLGRIWIDNGEVIDAVSGELKGEAAFHHVLAWKAGNFESLPPEPKRARTIFNSYQGLLLETAQAQDEAQSQTEIARATPGAEANVKLAPLFRYPGIEFVVSLKPGKETVFDSRGLENPQPMAEWSKHALEQFRALGERLQAGPLQQVSAICPQHRIVLAPNADRDFCVAWKSSMTGSQVQDSMKKLLALWES